MEQLEIELDTIRSQTEEYKLIDRIIATRETEEGRWQNPEGGLEYLVKWNRLSYSEATWEPVDEISDEFQAQIDAFLDRQQSTQVPHRSALYLKKRPVYKPFQKQPDYLVGGELRDFQLLGVNWMAHLWHNHLNGILADEMVGLFSHTYEIVLLTKQ